MIEMEFENPKSRSYLIELYNVTGADLDGEASMYEVGASLGLEKSEAGMLAEELMVEGLVELKSLAGGIRITAEGLRLLDVQSPESAEAVMHLSDDLVLGEQGRITVESVIDEIKAEISREQNSYTTLEEIVIDIKTLEVQLLSPIPKTAIIREVLRSISAALSSGGSSALGAKVREMIKR
jgi:hypothetical protein